MDNSKLDLDYLIKSIDKEILEQKINRDTGDQGVGAYAPIQIPEKIHAPFLSLRLSRSSLPRNVLRGRFRGHSFLVNTPQSGEVALPAISCDVWPLIEVLAEEDVELTLGGEAENGAFCVDRIGFTPSGRIKARNLGIDDGRLQGLLGRLLGEADLTNCPAFTTKEQLQFLLRVVSGQLPKNLLQWAKESFATLNKSVLGSTEKRHILNALSYILSIDWRIHAPNVPDTTEIRRRLDNRFFGLEPVKQRVLEIAAQLRRTRTLPKWGILLNGPAGVGKTSIAHAIGDILGMPAACLEFSILRDSESLTGSSRIYDNGKPGLIIERLYANRTANLIMVLNEIDKAAEGKHSGSPLDVLLSLLDGTAGFTDTYIEAAIPTDGLFYIATCNDADGGRISKPILDRFLRIDIPAYSADEKRAIFDQYILPRALSKVCLRLEDLVVTQAAKRCLLRDYALEPGVRDLERVAEKLVSSCLLKRENDDRNGTVISESELRSILGPSSKGVRRSLASRCGTALSAIRQNNGQVKVFGLQAAVLRGPGRGSFELINVEGGSLQKASCLLAYEAVNLLTGGRLRQMDVVVAATGTIHDVGYANYTGTACAAAILSALSGQAYDPGTLFLGGCDLYGRLFLDEATIDPYLELSDRFQIIYTASGAAARIFKSPSTVASICIAEAPDIAVLYELAQLEKNFTL